MADTDLERQRRSRAHRRGDHSLCRANCGATATPGTVKATVVAALEAANRTDTYLGAAAIELAKWIDRSQGAQGVAPMVKELRETMTAALAGSRMPGKLLEMRNARKRGPAAVDSSAS